MPISQDFVLASDALKLSCRSACAGIKARFGRPQHRVHPRESVGKTEVVVELVGSKAVAQAAASADEWATTST